MSLPQLETIILMLVAVLALTAIAQRLVIPYPILLVVGGIALSFVPGLTAVQLDPELVFLVFLPPILWAAAYFTSLNDFKANARPIFLLAFGLVLATTAAVAYAARLLFSEMGWAVAITLGAIVSPPDAVAATSIMRRLQMPRRIVTVLEGESLVNDATALVLYRVAVAAAMAEAVSVGEAFGQFALSAVGGVAIGVAVGYVSSRATALSRDVPSDILITLLAPYVAWVVAERIHVSAVLACVAGGLTMRRYFSVDVSPETRLQGRAVWDLIIFLLTGVIFMLIGLQLAPLREVLAGSRLQQTIVAGLIVSAVVVVARLVWVPLATWLPRRLFAQVRRRDPMPPASSTFLVSWIGMRGVVSLAAALALPGAEQGQGFPYRAEIIVITFTVIVVTLVVQGLSLKPLVGWLRLQPDDTLEQNLRKAREATARAALEALEELSAAADTRRHAQHIRDSYAEKLEGLLAPTREHEKERALRAQVLDRERAAVIALRDRGEISDDALIEIELELDTEQAQLKRAEEQLNTDR